MIRLKDSGKQNTTMDTSHKDRASHAKTPVVTPGQVIKTFTLKDGRGAVIRGLTKDDTDGLLVFVNELIAEDTFISMSGEPMKREAEESYVEEALKKMAVDMKMHLILEIEGKIAGSFELRREERRKHHVASIGISLLAPYRNLGLGQRCMETLIDIAKAAGIRLLYLTCFENNMPALHVYEKAGFVRCGNLPRALLFRGSYVGEEMLYLDIAGNQQ